ncbi:MAG: response regulator transcription factor [Kiritimatiellae bacterium]|nr:response regulator transcription factor [Kiritimatiellia bacterium]
MKIRVLIADDHTIVRAGLTALLGTEKDIEVVGEAKNGAEAVSGAVELHPDIVIMDLMMPKMDGVEATKELVRKAPSVKTILLTTYGTSDGIAHALWAGARGAVLKNADNSELAKAIRIVAQGGDYISPDIRQQLEADPPVPDLTPRQSEILESMVRGLTDRDIAQQLGLSPESVSEHVGAIRQKIGAANRTEAVAIAMRKYLLKF